MLFFEHGPCLSPVGPACHRGGERARLQVMASLDRAQLSSIAETVEETVARVADLGERLDGAGTSDAANALFEAERSLKMAGRALARAGRSMGDH